MKIRLWAAAIGIAVSVSACVTVPPNPLTAEQRSGLQVTEVRVTFAPTTRLEWADYVNETAGGASRAAAAADEASPVATSLDPAQSDALLRTVVSDRVSSAVREAFRTRPAGARPVRVEVQVNHLLVPSAIQRILIGGPPALRAEAVVVDARTGAPIVSYPESQSVGVAGAGPLGVVVDRAITGQTGQVDRVANSWAARFADWLYGPKA